MLCTAQALDILNLSSVNMALPDIASDLAVPAHDLSWIVSAYTLSFGGFLMVAGRAADLYGRRRIMLAGMILFGASSLVLAVSGSFWIAVAARGVQGLGAAATVSAALGLVGTLWPEEPGRSRALGAFGAMGGVGLAIGLVLGGALAGALGWRSMFYVNVIVVAALVAGTVTAIPADRTRELRTGSLDVPGALLATCGLLALSFALTRLSAGVGDPLGWIAVAVAVGTLSGFGFWQRRAPDPLLPPALWKQPGFAPIVGIALCLYAGWVGVNFYAALLLQDVLGYTPLRAGAAFLPLAIGGTVLPLLAGSLVPRIGTRRLLLIGLSFYTVGLALFTVVGPDTGYWWGILPILIVVIIGLSQTFVAGNVFMLSGAPAGGHALTGAVWNTALQVGGGLGLTLLSAAESIAASPLAGYRAAFLTAACIAAVALLLAVVGMRTQPR
jgi:MFS family permease